MTFAQVVKLVNTRDLKSLAVWLASSILALGTTLSYAEPVCDRVQIYGFSYHKDRDVPYKEINPGVGCEKNNGNGFTSLGVYDNSYGDPTLQLSFGWTPLKLGRFHFGGVLGAVIGYEDTINFIPPIPAIRYRGDEWGTTAYIAPEVIMFFFTKEFK